MKQGANGRVDDEERKEERKGKKESINTPWTVLFPSVTTCLHERRFGVWSGLVWSARSWGQDQKEKARQGSQSSRFCMYVWYGSITICNSSTFFLRFPFFAMCGCLVTTRPPFFLRGISNQLSRARGTKERTRWVEGPLRHDIGCCTARFLPYHDMAIISEGNCTRRRASFGLGCTRPKKNTRSS